MPAIDVAVVLDAPIVLAVGQTTSRVQIAKTGRFTDPRYGKFSITGKDFSTWIKNFQRIYLDAGREGLPVDQDHAPEKQGTTEAAGWVHSIDMLGKDGKSATPDELWAVVEWNSLGQELIRDKRYLYLSPSYLHDYEDEAGVKYGTALVGIGLTNRPFLTMATVSLSRAPVFAAEDPAPEPTPSEPGDSRERMALPKAILDSLGLSEDATDEQATVALTALKEKADKPEPTTDDKTLEERAAAEGKTILSAADLAELQTNVAAGAAAAETLRVQSFDSAFSAALAKGQVIPAEKDDQRGLYDLACKAGEGVKVLEALSKRPENVHVKADGHGSEPNEDADNDATPSKVLAAQHERDAEGLGGRDSRELDKEMVELDARANRILDKGEIKDYGEAVAIAARDMGIDD